MMIDDDTLKQLLRINDELLQLCKWLNEKARHGSFISPHTAPRRPYPYSDRSGQEQVTVIQWTLSTVSHPLKPLRLTASINLSYFHITSLGLDPVYPFRPQTTTRTGSLAVACEYNPVANAR
jgi:hypothetical protein